MAILRSISDWLDNTSAAHRAGLDQASTIKPEESAQAWAVIESVYAAQLSDRALNWQADYRPKVHRRGDSQADWPRRLWRNGHISEYARRFGDALLNAKASHRCSLANTNPPASNARPVGMHVRRGGLPGWRSIGRSVTQKKMFPAQSATSCQELSSVSNSSVGIFATLAMKDAFPVLKAKAHDDSGSS